MQALAFSADSQHLVSGGDADAIIIWCCTSGRCLQKLDVSAAFDAVLIIRVHVMALNRNTVLTNIRFCSP